MNRKYLKRSLVVRNNLTEPAMPGYQQLQTKTKVLQFSGLKLLSQSNNLIVLGDTDQLSVASDISVNNEWLSKLAGMNEQELFTALQKFMGVFLFIFHIPESNEFRIISDRSGHYKLYFAADRDGFRLCDDISQYQSDSLATTALSEYVNYRWNNTEFSYFNDVMQIFNGEYAVVQHEKIIKRIKYNNVFWGQCYLTKAPCDDLKSTLLAAINKALKPELPTYVLLSGGVDSAVLLGLTKILVPDVIALTPNHYQHPNPELQRAVQFAEALAIPHKILQIADTEIDRLFAETTLCVQQAPRYQSSLTLYHSLSTITEPANIIYGEAADTLFGSAAVKRYTARVAKINKTKKLPYWLRYCLLKTLPDSSKLAVLLRETQLNCLLQCNKLDNPDNLQDYISFSDVNLIRQDFLRRYNFTCAEFEALSETDAVAVFKQWLLDTDICNHMYETGKIAGRFSHNLVTPFLAEPLLNFAKQIPATDYFGQSHVKPLLRKLGTDFFPDEWMYLPKLGFPVPYKSWLKHQLKANIDDAKRYFSVSDCVANDELDWTLAGMYCLVKGIGLSFIQVVEQSDRMTTSLHNHQLLQK